MRFLSLSGFLLAFALWGSVVQAAEFVVVPESTVTFAGKHAGNAFEGQFTDWQAEIQFDAADLANSAVNVTFSMANAMTGNAMYDGTLPSADWFDVKNHPTAVFNSTAMREGVSGTFVVEGLLAIKGVAQPVSFTFVPEGDALVTQDTFSVSRLVYGIGKKSDPTAEWVSEEIEVRLNVTALPKQ